MEEAGYTISQISRVELDEEEGVWEVHAFSGSIEIDIEIDPRNGEVTNFSTDA